MEKAKAKAARLLKRAALRAKAKLAAVWEKSKAVGMSVAVALSMSLPAFASEGGSSGDLTAVVSATDTITSMVNKAWAMMMANPLLTVYVAAGLLSTGIGFFAYLRRVSHH